MSNGGALQRPTNPYAIASLCCSIGGYFTVGISAILGLVFGYRARREIQASGGAQGGERMANAGIIIGWVMIVLESLVLLFIVIGSLLAPNW